MILRSAVENVLNDAKTKKKKYGKLQRLPLAVFYYAIVLLCMNQFLGFPITLNNEQEYNDDIDDLEKKNEIIKSDSYTESSFHK